jgi:hypothetical protein
MATPASARNLAPDLDPDLAMQIAAAAIATRRAHLALETSEARGQRQQSRDDRRVLSLAQRELTRLIDDAEAV